MWPGTPSPVVTPGVVPRAGYIPPPGGKDGGYVGGWQEGDMVDVDYERNFAAPWHRNVDPTEALMAEMEMLQQQLQMETDNERAMALLSRIDEIAKELEMGARNFGMAAGGIASLMGF